MTNGTNKIYQAVTNSLEQYYRDLDGDKPTNLYEQVLDLVEKPMLEFILGQCNNNQSQASIQLGINRNTLRKKMLRHQLLQ